MKVKVTQEHINKGVIDSEACPIALAIKELVDQEDEVYVSSAGITIGDKELDIPEVAEEFVRAFDSSETVMPFEFELDT